MYCICCKEDTVLPYDIKYPDFGRKSNKVEDSDIQVPKLTEVDLLWEKVPTINNHTKQNYNRSINNAMVDNGIIQIIDAGYGSTHDGDKVIIAICDKCIKENLEESTLLYYGNYMFEGEHTKEEIEKSKKLYNRRKNLDTLTKKENPID